MHKDERECGCQLRAFDTMSVVPGLLVVARQVAIGGDQAE